MPSTRPKDGTFVNADYPLMRSSDSYARYASDPAKQISSGID